MPKSKADDKADATEVAAIRLDVEAMGDKVTGLQTEVTEVKSQLTRIEEMMLRMETLMQKQPSTQNDDSGEKEPSRTLKIATSAADGAPQGTTSGTSPILNRGTPVWRCMGRQDQSNQEYHDFTAHTNEQQQHNYQQAYYDTAAYAYNEHQGDQ